MKELRVKVSEGMWDMSAGVVTITKSPAVLCGLIALHLPAVWGRNRGVG